MSDTSARKLYDLVKGMNAACARASGESALSGTDLGRDFAEFVTRLVVLKRDTSDEIMRAQFPSEERTESLIERVDDAQRAVLNALSKRGGTTRGALVDEVTVERLLSVAEQIENAGISGGLQTSREDMVRETEALIDDVKKWELEDYAKKTLTFQLTSVVRLIQASDTYSAADLRLRIKEIIADFAAEFARMDKKHQTQLDRMVLWARRGFFAGTTFLGLTADVATITGALPPPVRLIGKD